MSVKRKIVVSLLIIVLLSVITYGSLGRTFFQQDEWSTLGRVMKFDGFSGLFGYINEVLFVNKAPRILPLTKIVVYFVFKTFGLNTGYYGVFSFFVATFSGILVFFTVRKMLKSYFISLIAAALWLTNSLASDAVTWASTVISSQFSFMFFVLGMYLLFSYLERPVKKGLFIGSLLSVSASLWFKESGLYYFAPFVLYLWLFSGKGKFFFKLKNSVFLLLPLFITSLLPRLVMRGNINFGTATAVEVPGLAYILYNLFLLPARGLFHIFLPHSDLYPLFHWANKIRYFQQIDGYVVDGIIPDAFSLLVSFFIVIVIGFLSWFLDLRHKKLLLFAFVSFFVSFVPLLLFQNIVAIVEPRYDVFPAFWMAILISVLISGLFNKGFRRVMVVILLFFFVRHHIMDIHKQIDTDILVGDYRRDILHTIDEIRPELGENNVFYFFTSYTGFYEFQSGFGQTLAVWFHDTGKIPDGVMSDADYWNSYYEGLKVYDGKKFGYFMTYEKLLEALRQNPDVTVNDVYAYYWDHPKHTVMNVSGEIRAKLETDL